MRRRTCGVAAASLLSACIHAAAPLPAAAARGGAGPEDTETLIKRQSQEFSDASATGNAAVLDRLLDGKVVFMNETGEIATKKDVVDSAQPQGAGVAYSLTQTDFGFEQHGSVAVTTFTDVLHGQIHGQAVEQKFRSTEVWLKEEAGWKMISSQTMTVLEDPPELPLPTAELDQYVGTYQAGPDLIYHVVRLGNELAGALGDGTPVAMKAELKDVLFTPGQPLRRKVFQRDAKGKVTGLVLRNNGHDIVLKRVG